MIKNTNRKINYLLVISLAVFILFCLSKSAFALTEVYFQKDIKDVKRGDVFSVNLKISSDKTINVIDGTLTYDKNILKVKELKIDKSLLSLWIKEPTFDNKIGEISFVGGFSEGFKGEDGEILEVVYEVKRSGTTMISFKDIFSVYENNGLGTQINPWLKPMTIVIDKKTNYIEYIFASLIIVLFIIIKLLKRFRKNGK